LVAWFVATIMYLLHVNHPTSLIGPTNLVPINGSFGKIIISLAKFYVVKPLTFWHASQDLKNSKALWNNLGHQYPAFKIFLAVMSDAKWPQPNPSWSSHSIIYASFVVTQHLVSWPMWSRIPFCKIKGSILLFDHC
jgi:hypothetical protein